jgi:hypothetical protein
VFGEGVWSAERSGVPESGSGSLGGGVDVDVDVASRGWGTSWESGVDVLSIDSGIVFKSSDTAISFESFEGIFEVLEIEWNVIATVVEFGSLSCGATIALWWKWRIPVGRITQFDRSQV